MHRPRGGVRGAASGASFRANGHLEAQWPLPGRKLEEPKDARHARSLVQVWLRNWSYHWLAWHEDNRRTLEQPALGCAVGLGLAPVQEERHKAPKATHGRRLWRHDAPWHLRKRIGKDCSHAVLRKHADLASSPCARGCAVLNLQVHELTHKSEQVHKQLEVWRGELQQSLHGALV